MQQMVSPLSGLTAQSAERTVLASALLRRDAAEAVRELVSPQDFTVPEYRTVFRAICRAAAEPGPAVAPGEEADPFIIHVAELLESRGELEGIGGAPGLKAMADWSAVSGAPDHYAGRVRMAAVARQLATDLQDIGREISLENLSAAAERLQQMADTARGSGSRQKRLGILDMAIMPELPEPIIDGMLRPAEVCTVIAAPKSGKSWLTYGVAYAVAYGLSWFGHQCKAGKVLMVDNELQPNTLRHRLHSVYSQLHRDGVIDEPWDSARDRIQVVSLRGKLMDIGQLVDALLADYRPGDFEFISIDALYRTLPAGISENDNAGMAGVYNQLDRLASTLGAAVLCVHHSSKGNQAGKSVTDVGSGAGAISRAADSHLVLREHETDGVYVLDGVHRSFPPADPASVRFEWPLWKMAFGFDPHALRQAKRAKSAEDRDGEILDAIRAADKPVSKEAIRQQVKINGTLNTAAFNRLYDAGQIRPVDYSTGEPLQDVPATGRALWEAVDGGDFEPVVTLQTGCRDGDF